MEGYEFVGELHRLGAIAGLFEKIDLAAMGAYLTTAQQVAPIFEPQGVGRGSEVVTKLQRFIAKAQDFQAVCREYGMGLREAEDVIGVRRLPAGTAPAAEGGQIP